MTIFSIQLDDTAWRQAVSTPGLSLKGQTYLDGKSIDADGLASHLGTAVTIDTLTSVLLRLNGFYAWTEQTPGRIRAAVDHIRSQPLFYACIEQRFLLSDDAEWVRQQVGDLEMDPVAREEFQLAGYVTGAETLFPNVKQLQAGEVLVATQQDNGVRVETHRYYRFLHTEPEQIDEPALRSQLDQVAVGSIQRLIDYANGRQIVVPLSGGYDSRLIVTLLKRLGYENVLTFSYGLIGNKEAEFSSKVAEELGFKWIFIEYTNALWARSWSTLDAKAYRDMAANHVSLPHVQDWLAVRELVRRNEIERDAILVPGHSGDFVAGSHIPAIAFTKKRIPCATLLQSLKHAHLSNIPTKYIKLCKDEFLYNRIKSRIGLTYDGSNVAFANLYELWDWQERQSKYIVNSVKAYEHYKLDWWLPLWDLEFVRFWENVPLIMRKKRKWYVAWVNQVFIQYTNLDTGNMSLANASESLGRFPLARKILDRMPTPVALMIRAGTFPLLRHRTLDFYKNHFLALGGLVPLHKLKRYLDNSYNIIGIYSDLYLTNQWNDIRDW